MCMFMNFFLPDAVSKYRIDGKKTIELGDFPTKS